MSLHDFGGPSEFWGGFNTPTPTPHSVRHCLSVHFNFNEISAPGNKRFHTVIHGIFIQLLTLVLYGKCLVQILVECSFVDFFQSLQATVNILLWIIPLLFLCISMYITDCMAWLTDSNVKWITNRQYNQPNTWQSRNYSYYFLALLSIHYW